MAKSQTCASVIKFRYVIEPANIALSIRGLEYVKSSAEETKRPSVASMSLGGGASTALDKAVQKVGLARHIPTYSTS